MQTLSSPRCRISEAVLLVLGGILLVVLLLFILNHFLVQPAFQVLERSQAIEDNDRVSAALAQELAALTDLIRDWAHWDDTYAFVHDPTPAFIATNCPDEALLSENSGIDILAIFNKEGTLLLRRAFHPGLGRSISLALFSDGRPPLFDVLTPTLNGATPQRGLIDTEHGLLLLTAEPILTSEKKGPPRGILLMGRFIDDAKVAAFAERTKVAAEIITRRSLTDAEYHALFDPMAGNAAPGSVTISVPFAYRALFDIGGTPIALLRTSVRGDITLIGIRTGHFLITVLGSIALALLICLAMYRWRMETAQHALQESEECYRQLFEAESDAIFLIAQNTGRILEANRSATVLYGYTHEELLCLSDAHLSGEPAVTWQAANGNVWDDEQIVAIPLRWHRKKDGTVFPVEITGRFFFHKRRPVYIFAIRDITERKRVEDQLRFTQFAVDHFGDGAFWINRDGRLEYVNEEGRRSLGYTQEELIGKSVADIDPCFPFAQWPMHWKRLQEQKHLLSESSHKTKDNQVFPVEIQANYVAFGDRELNCAIVRDISERKRLERERAELEAINWQLHKEESLGRMAGAIAHHFNNQLMAIMGSIEIAFDDLQSDKQASAIQRLGVALSSVAKAAAISQSMLTYLGQNCSDNREPHDLADICEQSLPVLEAILPDNVVIHAELERPGPRVKMNGETIRQILINLVTNSVESFAGDAGWIRIEIRTVTAADLPAGTTFPVDWQPQHQTYGCVSVADNGCGIAQGGIENLFDPFYSTKFTGRGLGLAVVLGMVKACSGGVKVKSELGGGSVFTVILPLVLAEETLFIS